MNMISFNLVQMHERGIGIAVYLERCDIEDYIDNKLN